MIKDFDNHMGGKQISLIHFIIRTHVLEGIIFDLKECLSFYAEADDQYDCGYAARNILKQYNKSFDELYEEAEKKMAEFEEKQNPPK